jgi:hypothetical protein
MDFICISSAVSHQQHLYRKVERPLYNNKKTNTHTNTLIMSVNIDETGQEATQLQVKNGVIRVLRCVLVLSFCGKWEPPLLLITRASHLSSPYSFVPIT